MDILPIKHVNLNYSSPSRFLGYVEYLHHTNVVHKVSVIWSLCIVFMRHLLSNSPSLVQEETMFSTSMGMEETSFIYLTWKKELKLWKSNAIHQDKSQTLPIPQCQGFSRLDSLLLSLHSEAAAQEGSVWNPSLLLLCPPSHPGAEYIWNVRMCKYPASGGEVRGSDPRPSSFCAAVNWAAAADVTVD